VKITAISSQVKNPDRASIFLDGKYSFSLTLDQLLEAKLKKGLDLSDSDVNVYKKLSADGKMRAKAFEWLMIRPHSEREFTDYLKRKKVDPEQIRALSEEAKAKNLQNDEYFAKWFYEQRLQKSKSSRAIIFELKTKGVSPVTIKSIVIDTDASDKESLESLVNKLRNRSKYSSDPIKLKRYLLTKGFSYDQIKEALGE
jgi:regulatory protein